MNALQQSAKCGTLVDRILTLALDGAGRGWEGESGTLPGLGLALCLPGRQLFWDRFGLDIKLCKFFLTPTYYSSPSSKMLNFEITSSAC